MFLNPSSGAKLAADQSSALVEAAQERSLDVVQISPEIDVAAITREHLRGGRALVIAAGGDGTVHHVIQALVHNPDATLGVIPVGTYNHFARDLGIPIDWRAALDVATSGQTRVIDAAHVNDRYFVNNVSLGLYPELVARREERGRDYPRWKARVYAFFATLRKYPHVTIAVEADHHKEVIRSHVFIVSNNSYDISRVGIEAPRTALTEGRLSVYWLPHLRRLALFKFGAHYLAGRVRHTPGFRSFRTSRLRVHTRRTTLHLGIDGELFEMQTPLVITIAPQSLQVRVPM
jgi:YegS/Rv2252/BmrU family lipid kinase